MFEFILFYFQHRTIYWVFMSWSRNHADSPKIIYIFPKNIFIHYEMMSVNTKLNFIIYAKIDYKLPWSVPCSLFYFTSNGISLYSHLLIFSNHNIKLNWVLNFNEDRRHRNDGSSCPDLSPQRGKRRQTARGHLLSRRGLVLGPLGWESLSTSHQFCFYLMQHQNFYISS